MISKDKIIFSKAYFETVAFKASEEFKKTKDPKSKQTATIAASLFDYASWVLGLESNFGPMIEEVKRQTDEAAKKNDGKDSFSA